MKRFISGTMLLLLLALPVSVAIWAQSSHSVTIGWTYSQGADLAVGFNVYRSTVTGGPYTQINTTLIPIGTLTFTDSVVVAGSTYFYVVDAQDANGVHSAQSLESLAAVIPQNPTTPGRPTIVVH